MLWLTSSGAGLAKVVAERLSKLEMNCGVGISGLPRCQWRECRRRRNYWAWHIFACDSHALQLFGSQRRRRFKSTAAATHFACCLFIHFTAMIDNGKQTSIGRCGMKTVCCEWVRNVCTCAKRQRLLMIFAEQWGAVKPCSISYLHEIVMLCVAFEHLMETDSLKITNWTLLGRENAVDRIEWRCAAAYFWPMLNRRCHSTVLCVQKIPGHRYALHLFQEELGPADGWPSQFWVRLL